MLYSHDQCGGHEVEGGENRKHGEQGQHRADALGEQPTQQAAEGASRRDVADGTSRRTRVEALGHDSPEAADEERSQRGEVKVEENCGRPA
jgi:hypothetical protein